MPPTPRKTRETAETRVRARGGRGGAKGAPPVAAVEEPPDEVFSQPWEREWPRPWMRLFLESLSLVPDATSAARYSGVSKATVYRYRAADKAFAAAWEEAVEYQRDAFERNVHRWATTGLPAEDEFVEEEFDEAGKLVKRKVRTVKRAIRSERLAEFWLKAWFPDRYRFAERLAHEGADGGPVEFAVTKEEAEGAVGRFNAAVVRLSDRRAAKASAARGGG